MFQRNQRRYHVKNPVTPPRIDPGTIRLVAQRLNYYAAPVPSMLVSGKGKWTIAGYIQARWEDMQLNLISQQ
jgi:hypothetical protein